MDTLAVADLVAGFLGTLVEAFHHYLWEVTDHTDSTCYRSIVRRPHFFRRHFPAQILLVPRYLHRDRLNVRFFLAQD